MAKQHGGDNPHPTVKPRMGIEQIELLFAYVIRMPEIRALALDSLRPEIFNAGTEAHYQLLWKALVQLSKGVSTFDNLDHLYSALEIELLSRIRARPNALNPAFYDRLFDRGETNPGLLHWLFNIVKQSELNFDYGRELLKDFRLEREVSDDLQGIMTGAAGKTISDLPEYLRALQEKYVAIEAQATDLALSGAPEGWAPKSLQKTPTNIGFLDEYLKGGHARGECYGVLGAYGSGKTCLAVQIAYQGAKMELQKAAADPSYVAKDWFIFTYEATFDEIGIRLWSSACTVDHTKLEDFNGDWSKLTSIKNGVDSLDKYEKKIFAEAIRMGCARGERERLEEELPNFRKNFWVHDMTGTQITGNQLVNAQKGTGYIPEIVSLLNTHIHELTRSTGVQHSVGGVVIDYAGLCAQRHMDAKGARFEDLRHYVGRFGYKTKLSVAVPFQCPVWIFHQLDTKAQRRKVDSKAHHADAAEAKNFGENMVFCFQLGTKDPKHNVLTMSCSKARRGALGNNPLLHLEGDFFRLVRASGVVVNTFGEAATTAEGKTFAGAAGTEDQTPPGDDVNKDSNDSIQDYNPDF